MDSDELRGAAWVMLAAAVVFVLMSCQTVHGESLLCSYVNRQLKTNTPEQLEAKARRWHVPKEYVDQAKACTRSSKASTSK